jgi:hypothetical protein
MQLKVTWTYDGYKVNVPNWDGGDVVTADEHDLLVQDNAALRDELKKLVDAVDDARARSWMDVDTMRTFIDALESARITVSALDDSETPAATVS